MASRSLGHRSIRYCEKPRDCAGTCGGRGLAAARTSVAREYYQLAELVASEDRQFAHNAAAGNAVLAAIAASDAICCLRIGRYYAGEDHRSATKLLEQVRPNGRDLAKDLAEGA